MSYVSLIGQLLLYTFILGIFFWSLKYAVSLYIFSRKREDINRLEARISILKMHLKGKIKRKCNKIESSLRKEPADVLEGIRPKLNIIRDLNFSYTGDYQTFLDSLHEITVKITEHVKLKHKSLLKAQVLSKDKLSAEEQEAEQDENKLKCKKLVKYDKAHVMIVIEIIQTTAELRTKIDEYNNLTEFEKSQKKINLKPEPISISNFEILTELVEQAKSGNDQGQDFQIFDGEAEAA